MPGNIRRAEHFVAFLKRFIEYLKVWSLSESVKALPNMDLLADSHESAPGHFRDTALFLGAP